MSLTYTELLDDWNTKRTSDGVEAVRIYDVDHDDPESVIVQWPHSVGLQHPVFNELKLEEINAQMNDTRVRVVETYSIANTLENRFGETWEWNLNAQQTHITAVKNPSDQAHYPSTKDAGSAIGVDGENVNGVDVYRPSQSLKVTRHVKETNLQAELNTIQSMLNKVNVGGWKFYKQGEVLFIGGNVRKTAPDDWLVEYNFLIARRQEGLTVTLLDGSEVTNLAINPWDYVWYRHISEVHDDGMGNKNVKRGVESVHIAKVYEYGNFGNFNLKGPT